MYSNAVVPDKKNLLRVRGVVKKTGLGRSSVYNKINPGSKYHDATFPKPIRIGANSVVWIESEIDAWIDARVAARDVA